MEWRRPRYERRASRAAATLLRWIHRDDDVCDRWSDRAAGAGSELAERAAVAADGAAPRGGGQICRPRSARGNALDGELSLDECARPDAGGLVRRIPRTDRPIPQLVRATTGACRRVPA